MSPSATYVPAPGEEESIALALVNTRLRPGGELLDLLPDGHALEAWLGARQFIAPPARSLLPEELERVHALRAAVRELYLARINAGPGTALALGAAAALEATVALKAGAAPASAAALGAAVAPEAAPAPALRAALSIVNDAAALAPQIPRLNWTSSGPEAETIWEAGASALDIALASIAADAMSAVLDARGDRLRACEARGCDRLFIQDHGRRRWCSRACGDRVRVARHYAKTRSAT